VKKRFKALYFAFIALLGICIGLFAYNANLAYKTAILRHENNYLLIKNDSIQRQIEIRENLVRKVELTLKELHREQRRLK